MQLQTLGQAKDMFAENKITTNIFVDRLLKFDMLTNCFELSAANPNFANPRDLIIDTAHLQTKETIDVLLDRLI
jgi:hypothetical protein